jgi:DNA-binding MarR family transcriptional regulator
MNHSLEKNGFSTGEKLGPLELTDILKSVVSAIDISLRAQASPILDNEMNTVALAKRIYAMRRFREKVFAQNDLFFDPAWDILLDLYIARAEGRFISVSSACLASAVPATTGLRWLKILEDRALVSRKADVGDGRRNFIALTDKGAELVTRTLQFQ